MPVTFGDFQPVTTESPEDAAKRRVYEREQLKATRGDAGDLTFAGLSQTIPAYIGRQLAVNENPADDNWHLANEKWDELTAGIDPKEWSAFGTARSRDQALFIRANLLDQQERRGRIAAWGATGAMVNIAAQIVDPANLAIAAVTGGFGTLSQAGRLANAARAGLIAGIPFAVTEAYKQSQDPTITDGDVFSSAVAGFSLGAAGSIFSGVKVLPRSLAVGATSAVPVMALDAARQKDANDILANGGTTFALNAAMAFVHGAFSPEQKAAVQKQYDAGVKMAKAAQYEDVKASGAPLTPAGEAHFADVVKPEPIKTTTGKQVSSEAVANGTLFDKETGEVFSTDARHTSPPPTLEGSVGAATQAEISRKIAEQIAVEEAHVTRHPYDIDLRSIPDSVPKSVMAGPKVSFSVGGEDVKLYLFGNTPSRVLGQSNDPFVRAFGAAITHDPLVRPGETVYPDANTQSKSLENLLNNKAGVAINDGYASHIKYQKSIGEKPLSRRDFSVAVTSGVRGNRTIGDNPGFQEGIAAAREYFADVYARAARHRVPGYEAVEEDAYFVPRMDNAPAYRAIMQRAEASGAASGREWLVDQVKNAIVAASDTPISEKTAQWIAEAKVQRGVNADVHVAEFNRDMHLSGDVAGLKTEMEAALKTLHAPKEDVEAVLKHLDSFFADKQGDKGAIPAFKRRIPLDENYESTYPDGSPFKITDLFHNDAEHLMQTYGRRITGAIAVKSVADRFFPQMEGRGRVTTIDELKRLVAENTGLQYSPEAVSQEMKHIDYALKVLARMPLENRTIFTRFGRAIYNENMGRLLSGPGTAINAMAETADAIAETGVKHLFDAVPAYPEIIKGIQSGKHTVPELKELEEIGIVGETIAGSHFSDRTDQYSSRTDRAENIVAKFGNLGPTISGQRHVEAAGSATARLKMSRWFQRAAAGEHSPSELQLAEMGLTPSQFADILSEIRTHKSDTPGDQINGVIGWKNYEAAANFKHAIELKARTLWQGTDPASQIPFMGTTLGRLLVQFRQFGFMALANKTLPLAQQIKAGDVRAYSKIALGSIFAGIAYAARVALDSIGRDDASEYLAKKLDPVEVAKASFSRATFASLIPAAADTVSNATGHGDIFSGSRTTGLQGGFLAGNPTVDLLKNLGGVPQSILGPSLSDSYDFSREDVRRLTTGTWMPRAIGLQQLVNQLSSTLPKKSERPPEPQ